MWQCTTRIQDLSKVQEVLKNRSSGVVAAGMIGHGPAHQREDAEEEHNDLEEEANGEPRPYVSWLFIAS